MKPRHFFIAIAVFAVLLCLAATTTVRPGLKISQYPNNGFLNSNALFITEKGDGSTNENISFGQLALRVTNAMNASLTNTIKGFASNLVVVLSGTNILVSKTSTNGTNFYIVNANTFGITNGLASTNYVNSITNGLATTNFVNASQLWTNDAGTAKLTTNIPVQIRSNLSVWGTNLTGGLTVTQDMRVLGHNSTSNFVWTCTNSTTGEGEWRVASASVNPSTLGMPTNGNMLLLHAFPFQGAQYYVGTNGTPDTNGQRAALEWWNTPLVLNFGALGNDNGASRFIGAISNWWYPTNMGYGSVRFGSNSLVQSTYSSVLGGQFNQIANNSPASAIVSGTNNWVSTNCAWSFIGSGSGNLIQIGSTYASIVGGIDNEIIASAAQSFIGGGNGNSISDSSLDASIVGGFDNDIKGSGSSYSFIGGGFQNKVQSISTESSIVGGRNNLIGESASTASIRSFLGGGQGNWIRGSSDKCVIGGGFNNVIFNGSTHAFMGGGFTNSIGDTSGGSVICGGVSNIIGNSSSNGLIAGGMHNAIADSSKNAFVYGTSNAVSAAASGAIGIQNGVTAARALAIGTGVTNATSDSVTVGELISYNTATVVSGAGNGNTNYLLSVTSPKMLIGSSNVNIYGVANTINGKTHSWSVNITNLSADTWGIRFDSGTNRWKFQSWMYGTNAPSVLTNNTLLRLQGESQGTNTLVVYQYFSPAL